MELNNTENPTMVENNEVSNAPVISTNKPFIMANTIGASLEEIRNSHIIPVFIKDNEPVISHHDFVDITNQLVQDNYHGEQILKPAIRLSHPIKGRIPEARNKPAIDLLENEKTLYYERMAFIIEIASVKDEIDDSVLSLCVGGVKAYNLDNLYSRKGADEHFKIFVGFQNKVCTNLCVWSDGFVSDVRINSVTQLKGVIRTLLENYNSKFHLYELSLLSKLSISEAQFAHIVGRARIYQYLPVEQKLGIPPLLFGDNQISAVCKDYYRDVSFCRDDAGNINLWRLYNLFTGANKSSYIDTFLERGVNAYQFIEQIRHGIEGKASNWYLD